MDILYPTSCTFCANGPLGSEMHLRKEDGTTEMPFRFCPVCGRHLNPPAGIAAPETPVWHLLCSDDAERGVVVAADTTDEGTEYTVLFENRTTVNYPRLKPQASDGVCLLSPFQARIMTVPL